MGVKLRQPRQTHNMALRAKVTSLLAVSRTNSAIIPGLQSISNSNEAFRRRIKARKYATLSPSSGEAKLESGFFKPELVIFDKDGTLVCFHTMWSPWCTGLADRMNRLTGRDLAEPLYDVLGYDDKIEKMLVSKERFEPEKAKEVMDSTWTDTPEDMAIKLTANVPLLFQRLKNEGVKIAICTSDSREGTPKFLEKMKLDSYVDMIVCGDDPDGKPKPNPHNCLHICKKLNVSPTDTIMVGDTPADTLMGQQAQLGLTVGVLTGVGGLHDLRDADVILSDVKECVDMILPEHAVPQEKPIAYQVTTRGVSKIAQRSLLHHGSFYINPSSSGSAGSGRRAFSTSVSAAAEYSHIIVGAGSAGCVLANRLSEERQ